jgi:hypothetical protein
MNSPTPEEQQKIRDAEMLSKQYQLEIEAILFDLGSEPDEHRYRELKDKQAEVNRYLRSWGIDGA